MKNINWLGVVVALIAGQIIGMTWFGFLFSEQWLALSNITEAQAQSGGWMSMVYGALAQLITAIGLSWLITKMGGSGLMTGLMAGLAAFVFFSATTEANWFIYGQEAQGLIPIDYGYLAITYLVMGAIIGVVRLKPKAAAA